MKGCFKIDDQYFPDRKYKIGDHVPLKGCEDEFIFESVHPLGGVEFRALLCNTPQSGGYTLKNATLWPDPQPGPASGTAHGIEYGSENDRMMIVRAYNKGVKDTTERLEERVRELGGVVERDRKTMTSVHKYKLKKILEIREVCGDLRRLLDHEIAQLYTLYCEDNHAAGWTDVEMSEFKAWVTSAPMETVIRNR